jgi:hypothetical protein
MAEAMFAMLRERRIPFGFGFPSPRALLVGERLLGYRAHFPIREIAYPVPARARRPPGAVVSESVDESYDPLWDAARARLRTGLVRDRRRLNWRYHARPDRYYRFVTVRGANGVGALGVLSVVGETAFVVDAVVTGSSDSGLLLEALEGEAAAMGARQVVFWETPGGALAELARRGRAGETAPTVRDAGFSFVTAVVHEEDAIVEFVTHGQISAGIYDDR